MAEKRNQLMGWQLVRVQLTYNDQIQLSTTICPIIITQWNSEKNPSAVEFIQMYDND